MKGMSLRPGEGSLWSRLAGRWRRAERSPFGAAVQDVHRRLRGRTVKVFVRAGSCDLDLVDLILSEDSEYRLPAVVQPQVIFDVGANIGITAVYYSVVYPDADIYCFEPLPENLELLRINTKRNSGRIHVIPKGLSDAPGVAVYSKSADPRNLGGGGFAYVAADRKRNLPLPLTTVREVMVDLGVRRVDVFKIDTEGSELAVLRGTPPSVLAGAQAVIGELHGVGNWEVCQMLSGSHSLGVNKRLTAGCFPFIAVRNDLATGMRRAA